MIEYRAMRSSDRVLAAVLGRELRFEAQSDDDARVEMSSAMPAEYVDAFFSFFADSRLDESQVLATVQEVTGRPPARSRNGRSPTARPSVTVTA